MMCIIMGQVIGKVTAMSNLSQGKNIIKGLLVVRMINCSGNSVLFPSRQLSIHFATVPLADLHQQLFIHFATVRQLDHCCSPSSFLYILQLCLS